MKNILTLALAASLLSGCSGLRPVTDAALGAGGAYLGHELSHGNPVATAAGAAGGVLLGEGIHHLAQTQSDKSFLTGYEKGKSDAVKQQYWLYVAQQKKSEGSRNVRLYPLRLPEQNLDGVIFQPSTKYLRIEE